MFTVYILQDADGNLYKGATGNLERGLREHKNGGSKTTKRMQDFKVIYTEEYNSWESARKRELYFKSAAGRRFLKTKIFK